MILGTNIFNFFLYKNNYLVDFKTCPPISANKLRFNKELFDNQTAVLYWAIIIFALLSTSSIIVGISFFFTESDPSTAKNLLCLHGHEWGFLSLLGFAFGISIQLLVLLQINVSQYVLVRTPYNMGIFENDPKHNLRVGIRKRLSLRIE